jgi:hypothetical protein
MKLLALVLVVSFANAYQLQENQPPTPSVSELGPDSEIVISDLAPSAFHTIVNTGIENRVPMGIVIDSKHRLCETVMNVGRRREKLRRFIAEINSTVPGYKAEFERGVLKVYPLDANKTTQTFLNLHIPEFHSRPDTHQGLGIDLWMFIRAAIAPGQGTGFVGGSSTKREIVPAMDVTDQSVDTILDAIVRKGGGAAWVLQSSKIEELSQSTPARMTSSAIRRTSRPSEV